MADNEKVYLYTAPECDVCDKARAGLRAEGVDFEERDVMKNKEWFDFVVKHTIFVPLVVRGDAIEIGWKGAYGWEITWSRAVRPVGKAWGRPWGPASFLS